jgi:hypothetical protein
LRRERKGKGEKREEREERDRQSEWRAHREVGSGTE